MSVLRSDTRPARRRLVPAAAVAAASAAVLVAGPAAPAGATTPTPLPGTVPGTASIGGGATTSSLDVFYTSSSRNLVLKRGGATEDLGGVLTSGPSAVSKSPTEFVQEAVYARAQDGRIWRRAWSDGQGTWGAWDSEGGRSLGAPSATCVGEASAPDRIYVRGLDGALWRRVVAGGSTWGSLRGVLASDPVAVPAVGGDCASTEDVVALGSDGAVWEFTPTTQWRVVGGRSTVAPAIVQLPGGETNLFVRGTDNALWWSVRPAGSFAWRSFQRIGGTLSSAPNATVFPVSPATRTVHALGADGQLWRFSNAVGSTSWTWAPVG